MDMGRLLAFAGGWIHGTGLPLWKGPFGIGGGGDIVENCFVQCAVDVL